MAKNHNKRPTIIEVAREAGVSTTAVSFAFNNPSQLNPETIARIFRAVDRLGYSPSPIAKALLSRRTNILGILVPFTIASSFANPFIANLMEGVGSVCDEHSMGTLIVSPFQGSLEEATKQAPVDGFIVLGLNETHTEVDPLTRRKVPFVILDGDAQTVSQINSDDVGGAYAAAEHLLAKGHRDILILTFESPAPIHEKDVLYGVGGRRLKGYLKAFATFDTSLHADWLVQSLTSIEGGGVAFREAWSRGLRPTAVLAVSDAMALGVIAEAQRLGLNVPQDLEVIGFDDISLSAMTCPALTTVHQPIFEKGQSAARLLIARIEDAGFPSQQVDLPTQLIFRNSTR